MHAFSTCPGPPGLQSVLGLLACPDGNRKRWHDSLLAPPTSTPSIAGPALSSRMVGVSRQERGPLPIPVCGGTGEAARRPSCFHRRKNLGSLWRVATDR